MNAAKPCKTCGHNKTRHKWDRRPGVRICFADGCECIDYIAPEPARELRAVAAARAAGYVVVPRWVIADAFQWRDWDAIQALLTDRSTPDA